MDRIDQLAIYLHLARASRMRRRTYVTGRLYTLAAHLAHLSNLELVAQHCRTQVLTDNPLHALSRWATVAEAHQDETVLSMIRSLLRRYPLERAERLLESLGIDRASERACYADDCEYAAGLLGTTPAELKALYEDLDQSAGES